MDELLEFQKQCEGELISVLKTLGHYLINRKIEGVNEKYVRANISGVEQEIYIYEDEAGIQGHGTDIRFEAPDYLSS